MDIFTFMNSAVSLYPYFESCCTVGLQTALKSPTATFTALRPLGLNAKKEMLAVTNGINTHKGVIFSMGILCGAVGRVGESS